MAAAKSPLPRNEKGHSTGEDLVQRRLDCAVIHFLHILRKQENLPPFECLRGAFFEGDPLYPGSGMAAKTHIQWCVRNPMANVRGYFRPLPDWVAPVPVAVTRAHAHAENSRTAIAAVLRLVISLTSFSTPIARGLFR